MTATNRLSVSLVIVFLSSTLLTGCGDSSTKHELKQYVSGVKQRQSQPLKPIPEVKPYKRYAYPEHARNPFKPIPNPRSLGGRGPDQGRPKQALEAFSFDSLRMVGTLREGSSEWALIGAPDGAVYRAMVGNYVGQNYGKVTGISAKAVKVEEMVQVGNSWEKRPATLALTKEQEK